MNNEELSGVYKAIVTDTSCYRETGRIKTRISVFNMYSTSNNLLNDYNSDTFEKSTNFDALTYIMMPFGGGYNYGMFKLPEVNSVGLVTFINNNPYTPVWIGSLPNVIVEGNSGTIITNETPSDSTDNNYCSTYTNSGSNVATDNITDEHAFVIKTKSNTFEDPNQPNKMDWTRRPVENTLIMNRDKTHIIHEFTEELEEESNSSYTVANRKQPKTEVYQEIKLSHELDEDGKITNVPTGSSYSVLDKDEEIPDGTMLFNFHIGEDNEKQIQLNSDNIIIRNKKSNLTASIVMLDDGSLQISSSESNKQTDKTNGTKNESTVTMSPASLELSSGTNKITLIRNIDQSQEGVEISCKHLSINASDSISLGSTGHYLLAAPKNNISLTMEDGTMLTTVDNIMV